MTQLSGMSDQILAAITDSEVNRLGSEVKRCCPK